MIWSLSVPCDKSDRRRHGNERDGGGGGEQEIEGITISIFGLDRVSEEGRETIGEQRGEEEADDRYRTDKNRPRWIGGREDCKGLKINKNGG